MSGRLWQRGFAPDNLAIAVAPAAVSALPSIIGRVRVGAGLR
jgi:hypothetical protein